MTTNSEDSAKSLYFPALPGFEALFNQRLFQAPVREIDDRNSSVTVGFRENSSVLIEGPPGSGKTIATLAMSRSMVARDVDQHRRIYFLSAEVSESELERKLSSLGWFSTNNVAQRSLLSSMFVSRFTGGKTDRPLPKSEDLINSVFRQLHIEPRPENEKAIVVVDSLTGFLRDTTSPGERRRLTDDFLERLKNEFGNQLGVVFLITESPRTPPFEIPTEQYVTDYVFRLGHQSVPGGKRIRTWDVVKSHGTYMLSGQHTWEVFSPETQDELFFDAEYRECMAKLAIDPSLYFSTDEEVDDTTPPDSATRFGTVTFFPQVSYYLGRQSFEKGTSPESAETANSAVWSGTPGLDELLNGDQEYWSRVDLWSQSQTNAEWKTGMYAGLTTLLLGSSGTAKTLIALQFLYANRNRHGKILSLRELFADVRSRYEADYSTLRKSVLRAWHRGELTRSDGKPLKKEPEKGHAAESLWMSKEPHRRTLYLTFEGSEHAISSYLNISTDLRDLWEHTCAALVPVGDVDTNRLFIQLRFVIERRKVERIAVDGLAEFLNAQEPRARNGLTEALFGVFHNGLSNPRPTILATYELPPRSTAEFPEAEGISAMSDNVLWLRQVPVNDQLRKAVVALKARSRSHDRQIREIIVNTRDTGSTPGVRIQGGFEGYARVLSGDPIPVEIELQLFSENEVEHAFNRFIRNDLNDSFGFKVNHYSFTHAELSQFVDEARGSLGRTPSTDIKVVTLDEWWIRELQVPIRRATTTDLNEATKATPSPLLRIDGFLSLDSNSNPNGYTHEQSRASATQQALPSEHWITEVEKGTRTTSATYQEDGKKKTELDSQLLAMPAYSDFGLFCVNGRHSEAMRLDEQDIPRRWAFAEGAWFKAPSNERLCVADILDEYRRKEGRAGFAFDMASGETAVCFLMELAWGFGVREDFLNSAAIRFSDDGTLAGDDSQALVGAFKLLQYLVVNGLMATSPSRRDFSESLFVRQWYSTLNIDPLVPKTLLENGDLTKAFDETVTNEDQSVPLPFFPVSPRVADGKADRRLHVKAELIDIRDHISGICNRTLSAMHWVSRYRARLQKMTASDDAGNSAYVGRAADGTSRAIDIVQKLSTRLRGINTRLRKNNDELALEESLASVKELSKILNELELAASEPSSGLTARELRWEKLTHDHGEPEDMPNGAFNNPRWAPAALAMDVRDIRQMAEWARVRIRLVQGELAAVGIPKCLDDSIDFELATGDEDDNISTLAGFSCSGSWMLGVSRNTHSPRLSWKLIEEITSRRTNMLRATAGAGIPTRKDFYSMCGDSPVPRIPSRVSWREFFRRAGAKVRRREQAVCSKVPLERLAQIIRSELTGCLEQAAYEREKDADETSVLRMTGRAEDAAIRILTFVANNQVRTDTDIEHENIACSTCPLKYNDESSEGCGSRSTKKSTQSSDLESPSAHRKGDQA